jgi:hypothetical protein
MKRLWWVLSEVVLRVVVYGALAVAIVWVVRAVR